jgi:acyl-CoA dehydrogenase
MTLFLLFVVLSSFILLATQHASLSVWATLVFAWLMFITFSELFSIPVVLIFWIIASVIFSVLLIKPLRQSLISKHALEIFRQVMPKLSQTEQEALSAGTVGLDRDIFSGEINWSEILNLPQPRLTAEEQAFLEGPVEILCKMIDDFDITHRRADLPPEMWAFLKKEGFFGMIIPKQYGGKAFSAFAHSQIIMKVSSLSATVSTTIAVPNSLGPAELLLHYGTEAQKNYYLPRLARGEDIPCFALTSPLAGSDASSMPDTGIVCREIFEGTETLGIRLNWDKRYITLAPVATILGLAFKLYDPDHLLGDKPFLGITCALIPVNTMGVEIGRRHFPLNTVFQNGPTKGKDVFIPMDWIIGGQAMAGHGWRMLMECLSAGRAISLPSIGLGGAKGAVAVSTAYARIRKQFKLSIADFEGIQEIIGRMSGLTFMMDAARRLTMMSLDKGEKPSVISGIMKCYMTEFSRKIANDAMDIQGGKAICLGPRNTLGRGYQAIPISITVEGANILTRNMIIFGQGALRCHPYTMAEIEAAQTLDAKQALSLFDKALFGHLGYTFSNIMATFFYGLTGGRFIQAPRSPLYRYCQYFSRMSRAFACLSDLSIMLIGSKLKRKESLSGRFADIFAYLYMGIATIQYTHSLDYPRDGAPLVTSILDDLLYEIQNSFVALLDNYPIPFVGKILSVLIFPLGKRFKKPTIKKLLETADIMTHSTVFRDIVIQDVFLTDVSTNPMGRMQTLFHEMNGAKMMIRHIEQAIKAGKLAGQSYEAQLLDAVQKGILTPEEFNILNHIYTQMLEVIAVDDFSSEELAAGVLSP